MASGTNYSQEYGQAEKAYLEGDFTQAAEIIDRLAIEFPEDPNVLLLRGHIYCYGFQNYDLAQQHYEAVLELSEEQDLLDYAHSHIAKVKQLQQQFQESESGINDDFVLKNKIKGESIDETEDSIGVDFPEEEQIFNNSFDDEPNYGFEFDAMASESEIDEDLEELEQNSFGNPFSVEEQGDSDDFVDIEREENVDPFAQFNSFDPEYPDSDEQHENYLSDISPEQVESIYSEPRNSVHTSSTFMVDSDDEEISSEYPEDDFAVSHSEYDNSEDHEDNYDDSSELEIDTVLTEPFSMGAAEEYSHDEPGEAEGLDYQDELEFDEIDSSFFDLEELEQGLPDTGLFNVTDERTSPSLAMSDSGIVSESSELDSSIAQASPEIESTNPVELEVEPDVDVKQGALAGFINAPIKKKQLIAASTTGILSAIAVLGIGIVGATLIDRNENKNLPNAITNSALMSLVAGVVSFGTATFFGNVTAKQVEKASQDLQNQFDDVYHGNLNAKATVYAQDEFGQLATGFNRMTRVILTTTQEAQRRAEETEQAKEDLQRQVIRLLDDVEGAARGDLTVQATVTADVLGAVADAFNLTIQSLREIVRQVKEAAEQVNQGSTDSELFARNQSSEALRMAEELAVTLNSVQMMTESIERVADNAREAEEVARSSSVTALKGGKAVERTVAGIFQIRETVSETARKVKRLAEASQEISKIVLLISQIAERTNQLALNASIQAAKAGEAGRGFAVVADEVRQLADRSGKSLKEIEQIVLQIQSETGSVMTAMEEGIQEVIDVTDRAEQAKTALEDIIQVSNRIDTLVRSITADTVEQRENSRAVAQVMQSVELTAQATSQESQRVAGALQSLVAIARGLLSSVERFRIDKGEE
ncbi:MAG: hypothetical protein Tsb0014_23460 [Pleurocapsa sp.]